jgi:hypothetical protein
MMNRQSYKTVKPLMTGGISWAGDATMPAKYQGRTLVGGRPCLGPKGEAVTFRPLPGDRDHVVVHLEGRPTLAEAVAAYDRQVEEDERRNREGWEAFHRANAEAFAAGAPESAEAASVRNGAALDLPLTAEERREVAQINRRSRRAVPSDADIRGLEGNEDI